MKLFIFSLFVSFNVLATISHFSLDSHKSFYIIDGDSISLQMRIAGIDTPELNQTCRKYVDQVIDCGQLSKRYLHKLLKSLSGELVILPVGIDNYQRILVRVYKGEVNVGKRMIESGMAFSYKDTYKQEEKVARTEKIGFWGFDTLPVKPYKWRKLNKR